MSDLPDEIVERVAKAMQTECHTVFGSHWSNDVAARLARAALKASCLAEIREALERLLNPTMIAVADGNLGAFKAAPCPERRAEDEAFARAALAVRKP